MTPSLVPVLAAPLMDPGAGRIALDLPEGLTLAEIVRQAMPGLPLADLIHVRLSLVTPAGAEAIDPALWHRVRPRAGVRVVIRLLPGKNALRSILMIVVSVAAIALGGMLAPALAGATGMGLAVDTVQVSDPGNLGIQWWDNTASPRNVLGVDVSGRTIIVTLTGDPGALGGAVRGVLGIGMKQTVEGDYGPTGGNRTCIRDGCLDLSTQGLPMQNWLCHDRFIEGDDTFTPRP